MTDPIRKGDAADVGQIALVGLFVTALATAQVTASKLLAFGIPLSLPHTGDTLVLPGAALAYALTFFASDCYAELYGRRAATVVVNVGFAMNFVLLALVWSTILAPGLPAQAQPVDLGAFRSVLGASTAIVVGSLSAYVVSQNWDVFVFHWLRERTDGEMLWLRNVGSTATSLVDESEIKIYFGLMLLGGAVAVALRQLGNAYGIGELKLVSFALIMLSALAVGGAVIYSAVSAIRADAESTEVAPAD